jgi:YD repeat-containing protein
VNNGSEHEIASYQNVAYTYINDERLSSVTSGANTYYLAYDALGRCVKRTLNNVTTYYVYDGEKPILEYSSTGVIVGRNLYGKGVDEILIRTDTTVNSGQPSCGRSAQVTPSASSQVSCSRSTNSTYSAQRLQRLNTQLSASAYNNRSCSPAANTPRRSASTSIAPLVDSAASSEIRGFDAGDYNLFRYCHVIHSI